MSTFSCRITTWSDTSPEPSSSSSLLKNFAIYPATLDLCTGKYKTELSIVEEKNLRRCDFSGSKEAGSALAKMLRLGSSKPWQVIFLDFLFFQNYLRFSALAGDFFGFPLFSKVVAVFRMHWRSWPAKERWARGRFLSSLNLSIRFGWGILIEDTFGILSLSGISIFPTIYHLLL